MHSMLQGQMPLCMVWCYGKGVKQPMLTLITKTFVAKCAAWDVLLPLVCIGDLMRVWVCYGKCETQPMLALTTIYCMSGHVDVGL